MTLAVIPAGTLEAIADLGSDAPVTIELHRLELRLRRPFRHARHLRTHTTNLLVRARTQVRGREIAGFGEGLPRDYVTGETVESATTAFAAMARAALRQGPTGFALPEEGGAIATPALRCAIEMALLDLGAHLLELPLAALLVAPDGLERGGAVERRGLRYSLVISADDPDRVRRSARLGWLAGFRSVKVKVGLGLDSDRERVALVRRTMGKRVSLRVDANCAWQPAEAIESIRALLPYGVEAVEEPVSAGDHAGAAEVAGATGIPVVLDESLVSAADVAAAASAGGDAIANLRLSKLGGIVPTSRIASAAREAGIGLTLGCQVGETGLLSAAGRIFATALAPDIRWAEGSFDRHLLAKVPTRPDITFGLGGLGRWLRGVGLGVSMRPRWEAHAEPLETVEEPCRWSGPA